MRTGFGVRRWMAGLVVALLLNSGLAHPPDRAAAAEAVHPPTAIMLQTFGWGTTNGAPGKWYDLIRSKAPEIGACGFTTAWFPPASRSVSREGYLPGDYYDLGAPGRGTFYGDKDSLKAAIAALRAKGVLPIADIVINHRCAGKQDEHGIWNLFESPSGMARWGAWAICKDDRQFCGTGAPDSGLAYGAAPDLDHANPTVRADVIAWMKWLKSEVGFEGWRYDYAKGYAPAYIDAYDRATAPRVSVGEIWTSLAYQDQYDARTGSSRSVPLYDQNPHRQQLCDWLDHAGAKATTFDFTTKGILQEAVKGEFWRLRDKDGKASGLIGWWPERAVTFVDNHDTGSAQNHWPFPADRVLSGYAYILTHPGTPCVLWEHLFDGRMHDAIAKLTTARRAYGLRAGSKLEILKAENGLYASITDGKVAMKLGPNDWSPGPGFDLVASGEQWAVWGKKGARR